MRRSRSFRRRIASRSRSPSTCPGSGPSATSFWCSGANVARILAITNQKGGVGKTTTSVNLAASLGAAKRRVLLVDLDPQANATMGSGVDKRTLKSSVYELLIGSAMLIEAVVRAPAGEYDLLPANRELAGAEVEMVGMERREARLKEAL